MSRTTWCLTVCEFKLKCILLCCMQNITCENEVQVSVYLLLSAKVLAYLLLIVLLHIKWVRVRELLGSSQKDRQQTYKSIKFGSFDLHFSSTSVLYNGRDSYSRKGGCWESEINCLCLFLNCLLLQVLHRPVVFPAHDFHVCCFVHVGKFLFCVIRSM